ncbi:conserved hypothetical protein [Hahella chejuensis KCTC 2396]|uniref:Uncharacterized protein n=1 Tax=Hahella chejuensis (strain KCTC 2396) TaxID=349521 RepID=Q2S8C7_HAHCH|nr:PIN domain-containing protein [Hahella chejuensis]ABC33097.1 conserved hypothetical protein [Hahella chejuensis KCTC 2396]
MARYSVILDACVLYPAPLRDLFMRLAMEDLFMARWTDLIHEEWINALMRQGKFLREDLERIKCLMDSHVRDAKVTGFEGLIESISLPDPDDRHVVAAAIRAGADAIVSFNLKDFPTNELEKYDLEVIHPDDFVCFQLELAPGAACQAIKQQREALKNPPIDKEKFLAILQKQQLPQTVNILRQYTSLI